MTEAQAMERWCPFAKSRSIIDAAYGRVVFVSSAEQTTPSTFCIASQCMAWRWQREDTPDSRPSATDGYCGLAGKP